MGLLGEASRTAPEDPGGLWCFWGFSKILSPFWFICVGLPDSVGSTGSVAFMPPVS